MEPRARSAFPLGRFFDTRPCASMRLGPNGRVGSYRRRGTNGADIALLVSIGVPPGTTERIWCNLRDGRPMEVYLAQPRGFCAGVVRAIEIVERALKKYGPPVYVRHEIVHNKYVVESLKAKGAIFVEELSEVPPKAMTIFSAHGVAKSVVNEAAGRQLPVLDATC